MTLGFIPEEIGRDPVKRGIVAPVLGSVLEQLSNGGGAKAVKIDVSSGRCVCCQELETD